MALLLVMIEDTATLMMNEFFDYEGDCYALSRSRMETGETAIDLQDFYEGTARSQSISGVPVIFLCSGQEEKDPLICGWYPDAEVFAKVKRPSVFLEGNILGRSAEAVLVPENERQPLGGVSLNGRLYEVVEEDDARYGQIMARIRDYRGKNAMIRAASVHSTLPREAARDYETCIGRCEYLARSLMDDSCRDITEICALYAAASRAVVLNSKDADGYYYLAMACHQLGRVREGMKAVNKALAIESEAADLSAMKANLLVSMGHASEAASYYHEAWLADGDEDYLIMEGRAYMLAGRMDQAIICLQQVEDKESLTRAGIHLDEMEKRWPMVGVRGFPFGKLFGHKNR